MHLFIYAFILSFNSRSRFAVRPRRSKNIWFDDDLIMLLCWVYDDLMMILELFGDELWMIWGWFGDGFGMIWGWIEDDLYIRCIRFWKILTYNICWRALMVLLIVMCLLCCLRRIYTCFNTFYMFIFLYERFHLP